MNSNITEYHRPVLLQACIDGLDIKPDGNYVDVTYGGGGHAKEILKHLKTGKLIAFDQDADASKNIVKNENLLFVEHNFRFMKHFLAYHKIPKVHGILADLGVSSHQIDAGHRGFTFREDHALDMRMNQQASLTAADVVNNYSETDLKFLFKNYGELKNAHQIARNIVTQRKQATINTTGQLAECLKNNMPAHKTNQYLAQVFQALRIEVNREMENLKNFLQQSLECLTEGGRLVVISYHSLEDRLVKNFIRWGNFTTPPEKDVYGNEYSPFKQINKKIITPTSEEIRENNRARSAKLRIAEKQ